MSIPVTVTYKDLNSPTEPGIYKTKDGKNVDVEKKHIEQAISVEGNIEWSCVECAGMSETENYYKIVEATDTRQQELSLIERLNLLEKNNA